MVISTRLRLQRRGMAFTGISYRILKLGPPNYCACEYSIYFNALASCDSLAAQVLQKETIDGFAVES